jgi:hypothetical protein
MCHWEGTGGAHQLLAYADDVNLLGDNIDTIKKNTETLIDASKEVGPKMNTEKTKYMLLILSPECRSKSGHKNSKLIVLKYVTVQISGDNSTKSKFDSGRN